MTESLPMGLRIVYVACWYAKANDLMRGTATRCAFVSTNSITQGEQVAPIWRRMDAEIDFAYRTFKWHNEAKGVAAVQCVIIGFHATTVPSAPSRTGGGKGAVSEGRDSTVKTIFDGDRVIPAKRINGYLLDGPDVLDFGLSRHPPNNPNNRTIIAAAAQTILDIRKRYLDADPRCPPLRPLRGTGEINVIILLNHGG